MIKKNKFHLVDRFLENNFDKVFQIKDYWRIEKLGSQNPYCSNNEKFFMTDIK